MKNIQILFFSFILLLASCNNNSDCLKQSGDNTVETRDLLDYKNLTIKGNFIVNLIQSNENKIIIKGAENLITSVESNISNRMLTIEDNNKCNWLRNYSELEIDIYFVNIDTMNFKNSNLIRTRKVLKDDWIFILVNSQIALIDLEFDCKRLSFNIINSKGKIVLKGKTERGEYYHHGATSFDASNLICDNLLVRTRTFADMYVNVKSNLSVNINNSGSVLYKGNPIIEILEQRGGGKIIKQN